MVVKAAARNRTAVERVRVVVLEEEEEGEEEGEEEREAKPTITAQAVFGGRETATALPAPFLWSCAWVRGVGRTV